MPMFQNGYIFGGVFLNFDGAPPAIIKKVILRFLSLFSAIIFVVAFLVRSESPILHKRPAIDVEKSFSMLRHLSVAPNAFFNAQSSQEEPARCHPGTREHILVRLNAQVETLQSNSSVWTHGPAGVGKTAVMRTLCEQLEAKGQLLGSFFFFRNDWTRNSGDSFVFTLAYQLCHAVPELCGPILEAFQRDAFIERCGIEEQAQKLLIEPIVSLAKSRKEFPRRPPQALVVDGLDECQPEYSRNQIIHSLNLLSESYPNPLLIVVASRPHFDIHTHVGLPPLSNKTTSLGIYHSSASDSDIRKYLVDKFNEIQQRHRLRGYLPHIDGSWPGSAVINTLVERASGQFIFAATVIRFVQAPDGNPGHRLDVLLGRLDDKLRPFEQLDNLYRTIFSTVDPSLLQETLDVLAITIVYPVFLTNDSFPSPGYREGVTCFTCSSSPVVTSEVDLEPLGLLLSNRSTYCHELVANLEALVQVHPLVSSEGRSSTLSPFHKSLSDFLTSERRAGPDLFVSPERPWEAISMASLRLHFWHKDVNVRAIMLSIHHPSQPFRLTLKSEARSSERQTPKAPRLLRLMNEPDMVRYNFPDAAARLSGLYWRGASDTGFWLACVGAFVSSLKKMRLPVRDFITLTSCVSIYAAYPELLVLVLRALLLEGSKECVAPGLTLTRPTAQPLCDALCPGLGATLEASPELNELGWKRGSAVSDDRNGSVIMPHMPEDDFRSYRSICNREWTWADKLSEIWRSGYGM